MLIMGAVVALGMAVVGVIRVAAAVEQTPVNVPQILINRDEPLVSETDVRFNDRQQQGRRFFFDELGEQLKR